jgi:hypothetical protein
MSDQSPDDVPRFPGEPPQPGSKGVPEPPIPESLDEDKNVVEDAAEAAIGAPAEEIERAGTGESPEDRPQA